jgi:hypothetical protein
MLVCLIIASVALVVLAAGAGAGRAHADHVAYLIDNAVNELCPAQTCDCALLVSPG